MPTIGTGKDPVIKAIRTLQDRCEKQNRPFPKVFTVDDCCATRKYVEDAFRNKPLLKPPRVVQDIRHLCHRIVDCISSTEWIMIGA